MSTWSDTFISWTGEAVVTAATPAFTVAGVNLGAHGPQKWTSDGTTMRVDGTLKEGSAAALAVTVGQVEGIINNPDEPAVPVIVAADTSLTGFYRVTGGSVEKTPSSLRSYWANYSLELERVSGFVTPVIESRLVGALRTNSHSIVVGSTVPWWATPTDATMDYATDTAATRSGDGGSVKVQYTTDGTLFLDSTRTFQCAPADFYDLAAKIEVHDGTGWRTLKGREIGAATAASTTGWRLTNDLVRVVYGGGDGLISVQNYAGGAWVTAKVYRIHMTAGATVGSAVGVFKTITVLRNGPECVGVRLGLEFSSTYQTQMNLDLSLRRGALWVSGALTISSAFVSVLTSISRYLGVSRDTAEAGTAHTSGIHATSADAGGGKYSLGTSVAKTNDLTQGGFWATTQATVLPFYIGYEPGSPAGPDTYSNQYLSWFAAVDETMRLARR